MLKRFIQILFLFLIISCSNLSPNKYQIKSTKENIECYKKLINLIENDSLIKRELIDLRNSKLRGESDLVFIKSEYRLIGLDEFNSRLIEKWKDCSEKIKEDNDLRGVRYIDKDLIILEIDKFDRQTISEKYSRGKTVETHRIIISRKDYDETKFKREKTKWSLDLGNDWTYEISHSLRY